MGEMREILFRGEQADSGKWVYGFISGLNDDEYGIPMTMNDTEGLCDIIVNPITVGQYTGLTEKNGRRIFEGDILHAAQGNFVVRWSESICSFVAGEKERMRPCMNSGTMNCCEVIGNIFDNPELLESDIHKT